MSSNIPAPHGADLDMIRETTEIVHPLFQPIPKSYYTEQGHINWSRASHFFERLKIGGCRLLFLRIIAL
jgi:hypothetical protein